MESWPLNAPLATLLEPDGFACARGLFGPATQSALRHFIGAVYPRLDDCAAGGPAIGESEDARKLMQTFRDWGGIPFADLAGYLAEIDQDVERFAQLRRDLAGAVARVAGDGWTLSPDLSYFRRPDKVSRYTTWHCDAEAADYIGQTSRTFVTVWTPLMHVGTDLPSLELIRGSHVPMMATRDPMQEDRHRSAEWVDHHMTGERAILSLAPGDALIFTAYTLHRTQQLFPPAPRPRVSCDLRFYRENDPPGQPRRWWQRLAARR